MTRPASASSVGANDDSPLPQAVGGLAQFVCLDPGVLTDPQPTEAKTGHRVQVWGLRARGDYGMMEGARGRFGRGVCAAGGDLEEQRGDTG